MRGLAGVGSALLLGLAGCAAASGPESIGVAEQAEGAAPVVGFPADVAGAEEIGIPVRDAMFASRGADYLATWVLTQPGAARAEAMRFDPSGKPAHAEPFELVQLKKSNQPRLLDVACAPAGDCLILSGINGPLEGNGITVTTLAADGHTKRAAIDTLGAFVREARVAHDADAGAFLVAWNVAGASAIHVADGELVEAAPFAIGDGSEPLRGVACAPSGGCLVLVGSGSTDGVIVTAAGPGTPTPVSADVVSDPIYGGGVYLATAAVVGPSGKSFGAIRIGLDGAPLDPMPFPITTLTQSHQALGGLGFDGSVFVAITTGFDLMNGHHVHRAAQATRLHPDGSAASPATVDLTSLPLGGAFACGNGVCELGVGRDAQGLQALSSAALRGSAITRSDDDLAHAPASQSLGAAFAFSGKVLAIWNEADVTLRSRWFDAQGHATGDAHDLDAAGVVIGQAASDDAGLVLIEKPNGARETRMVSPDGTLGPAVPLDPPKKSSGAHARFGILDPFHVDGLVALLRFDAEGHALDAEPITVVPAGDQAFGAAMAKGGDTFVIARHSTALNSTGRVDRIRDTGEFIDATDLTPNGAILLGVRGLACNGSDCMVGWIGTNSTGGRNTPEVWTTRLTASDPLLQLQPEYLALGQTTGLVFDGKNFLAAFTLKRDFGAARVEVGARVGRGMLNGDVLQLLVGTGAGSALLFTRNDVDLGLAEPIGRLHVLSILDGSEGAGGAGGAGAETTTSTEIVAGGGCACELGAGADAPWAIAITAALLGAARRRRSQRVHSRPK